jgi:hypothetical protein
LRVNRESRPAASLLRLEAAAHALSRRDEGRADRVIAALAERGYAIWTLVLARFGGSYELLARGFNEAHARGWQFAVWQLGGRLLEHPDSPTEELSQVMSRSLKAFSGTFRDALEHPLAGPVLGGRHAVRLLREMFRRTGFAPAQPARMPTLRSGGPSGSDTIIQIQEVREIIEHDDVLECLVELAEFYARFLES